MNKVSTINYAGEKRMMDVDCLRLKHFKCLCKYHTYCPSEHAPERFILLKFDTDNIRHFNNYNSFK